MEIWNSQTLRLYWGRLSAVICNGIRHKASFVMHHSFDSDTAGTSKAAIIISLWNARLSPRRIDRPRFKLRHRNSTAISVPHPSAPCRPVRTLLPQPITFCLGLPTVTFMRTELPQMRGVRSGGPNCESQVQDAGHI
jgi:hypothetical protein